MQQVCEALILNDFLQKHIQTHFNTLVFLVHVIFPFHSKDADITKTSLDNCLCENKNNCFRGIDSFC